MENLNIVADWQEAQRTLKLAKEAEAVLRKAVEQKFFKDLDPGTYYHELPNDWKLKAVLKQSYAVSGDIEEIDAVLDTFPEERAEKLVAWKPLLSVAAYKQLTHKERKQMASIVTVKPAATTVALVPPKVKKPDALKVLKAA